MVTRFGPLCHHRRHILARRRGAAALCSADREDRSGAGSGSMICPMVRDRSQSSRAVRGGFTLIEVLIVLAITALILVMLGQGIRLGLRGTTAFDRGVQTQRDMV